MSASAKTAALPKTVYLVDLLAIPTKPKKRTRTAFAARRVVRAFAPAGRPIGLPAPWSRIKASASACASRAACLAALDLLAHGTIQHRLVEAADHHVVGDDAVDQPAARGDRGPRPLRSPRRTPRPRRRPGIHRLRGNRHQLPNRLARKLSPRRIGLRLHRSPQPPRIDHPRLSDAPPRKGLKFQIFLASIRWRHGSPALSDRRGSRMAKPMPSWFGSVRLTIFALRPKTWRRRRCVVRVCAPLQACPIGR